MKTQAQFNRNRKRFPILFQVLTSGSLPTTHSRTVGRNIRVRHFRSKKARRLGLFTPRVRATPGVDKLNRRVPFGRLIAFW